MKNILHRLEDRIDNYKIKKKFYLLYLICILFPLIFTDSIIIYIVVHSERTSIYHKMHNMADAVMYSLNSQIEQAVRISKSIYIDRKINDFMDKEYKDSYEYVTSYQEFIKHMWFDNIAVLDNIRFTMYSDNDTIVNGGKFDKIEKESDSQWYLYFKKSEVSQLLYFDYDTKWPAIEPKRRMMFIQKLDFYNKQREKILLIELDYAGINRYLKKMHYPMDIFICYEGKIVLSNGKYTSIGKEFEEFSDYSQVSYKTEMNAYGADMEICVINPKISTLTEIRKNFPVILFLVLLNAVLPAIMLRFLHRSFTVRLGILSDTFKNIKNDENLIGIENVRGEDEIGSLMQSYNKMATRINALIQMVYKNKIKEQEMIVARQKAELLALHSQINPHFLFNTLESIRMHSILKKETETADMIEKLAILQRQYVNWADDFVEIEKETEFVRAYLSIQKYRFGSKLSYKIKVDNECKKYIIPKLSIVTFVENACVHGIESKAASGWIFVRIYEKDRYLYLEIEDTGKGMDGFLMEKLLWKMRNASIELLQEKERVGVVNACLRLKMETDEKAEFELDGEEGIGLMVQIKIPCKCLKYVD